MKIKIVALSSVPGLLFLLGILLLANSPLTIEKAITYQTQMLSMFFTKLKESNDVLVATLYLLYSLTKEVLVYLFLFLLFIGSGFLFLGIVNSEKFRSATDIPLAPSKFLIIMNFVFLSLAVIMTNFSLIMILVAIGIFISSIWVIKTPKLETGFKYGKDLVSSKLRLVNIFFAVGIFLILYLDLPAYKPIISESSIQLVKMFIPTAPSIEEAQKQQMIALINSLFTGMTQSIEQSYQKVEEPVKSQCMPVYNACVSGIENYKIAVVQGIEKGELGMTEEQLEQQLASFLPVFDMFANVVPLLTASLGFFVLEFLRFFVAIFEGLLYIPLSKIAKKLK